MKWANFGCVEIGMHVPHVSVAASARMACVIPQMGASHDVVPQFIVTGGVEVFRFHEILAGCIIRRPLVHVYPLQLSGEIDRYRGPWPPSLMIPRMSTTRDTASS